MSFNDGEVNRIKLTASPEAEFTPMKKLNPETFRLTGFVWNWNKKPLTLYDVIRDRSQYDKYIADQPKKPVVEVKEEEKKTEEEIHQSCLKPLKPLKFRSFRTKKI